MENILLLFTKHKGNVEVYAKVPKLHTEAATYHVAVYVAAPHNTNKELTKNVGPSPGDSILKRVKVHDRNLAAIEANHIKKAIVVSIVLEGLRVLNNVVCGTTMVRCMQYKREVDICSACVWFATVTTSAATPMRIAPTVTTAGKHRQGATIAITNASLGANSATRHHQGLRLQAVLPRPIRHQTKEEKARATSAKLLKQMTIHKACENQAGATTRTPGNGTGRKATRCCSRPRSRRHCRALSRSRSRAHASEVGNLMGTHCGKRGTKHKQHVPRFGISRACSLPTYTRALIRNRALKEELTEHRVTLVRLGSNITASHARTHTSHIPRMHQKPDNTYKRRAVVSNSGSGGEESAIESSKDNGVPQGKRGHKPRKGNESGMLVSFTADVRDMFKQQV
ncbi:hypothetical protein HPB50_018871 [Hyalomma asiaticum]|uniref:Uncharacterized protein n=1 Tax=Hyalomma asiaticum TaxID=266040 RepID=A0ACB7RVQ2_HYAAI|nr:hypothetical protein HPB50_018871 [Hyalomma asiaticum]